MGLIRFESMDLPTRGFPSTVLSTELPGSIFSLYLLYRGQGPLLQRRGKGVCLLYRGQGPLVQRGVRCLNCITTYNDAQVIYANSRSVILAVSRNPASLLFSLGQ